MKHNSYTIDSYYNTLLIIYKSQGINIFQFWLLFLPGERFHLLLFSNIYRYPLKNINQV